MTGNQLRWFGHVQRRSSEAPMNRVDCMDKGNKKDIKLLNPSK